MKHFKLVHVIKQGPLNYVVALALSNDLLRIEMIHHSELRLEGENLGPFTNDVS